jgi:KDO2-lipid IV(A) lauroyltransferase
MRVGAKARIEYSLARLLLSFGRLLPRSGAEALGRIAGDLAYRLGRRQRRVALRNLEMALPGLSIPAREAIVRGVFESLGRLLAEFSQFPGLTRENIPLIVEYDGLDHYVGARQLGRGVLFLTAHVGSWELSSFAHALYGFPMHFLTRPIDNPLVERLVTRYRTMSGNSVIGRSQAARDVLRSLAEKETVGILIDQNTTESEGVFVDFFGIPAATTTGLASLALRTEAPVVPGFIRWDRERQKHILEFQPPVELVRTGDRRTDILRNTQRFNDVIEAFVRRYPDQWLWIHKRWNTRPDGETSLYASTDRGA